MHDVPSSFDVGDAIERIYSPASYSKPCSFVVAAAEGDVVDEKEVTVVRYGVIVFMVGGGCDVGV